MGFNVSASLVFGYSFEEGFEFPWCDEDGESDIDSWWLYEVHGYKPPFEIYMDDGNYIGGVEPSKEKLDEYYAHKRGFEEKIGETPVKLEFCNTYDYTSVIIHHPARTFGCWGYEPEEIDPAKLTVPETDKQVLKDFLDKHGIEYEGEPRWWLSAFYG